MRLPARCSRALALTLGLALVVAAQAMAGENRLRTEPSDPCGFYRGQAYGRGLEHFSTEMVWACEAIANRRAAGMPLGERLLAAEAALDRYRAAVIAAGAISFTRNRTNRPGSAHLGTGEAAKSAIAETAGALAALDSIRSGF